MRAKAIAISAAIVWGAAMLLTGLVNLVNPNYGAEFLRVMSSLYPGFHAGTLGGVLLGMIYGLLDGAVGGYVFGYIYDAMMTDERRPVAQTMNRTA